ncbi:MAG TPA: magnesium transporter, partial [Fluviicola sp.]|nr:magnesium transporter [Fluviicola sp.]
MASGISEKVESSSSIFRISRARLPWLLIGMLGGTMSAQVISRFETNISHLPSLAFFIPLITAMGGNVGVQSSAIVVQSLARGNEFGSTLSRLAKELMISMINGLICSILIFIISNFFNETRLALVVSLSLFTATITAAILGTLAPLVLHKYKIDPALATGPFVTTSNDIIGLFIYFSVGLLFLN